MAASHKKTHHKGGLFQIFFLRSAYAAASLSPVASRLAATAFFHRFGFVSQFFILRAGQEAVKAAFEIDRAQRFCRDTHTVILAQRVRAQGDVAQVHLEPTLRFDV
eukprot:GHVR01036292.1.p1 GENE.GHVR01036292.1~~GHVR01036292.1.p1  ORF type:complete len:106 (+),score=2.85 GHVR01036292.1:366-683(+)